VEQVGLAHFDNIVFGLRTARLIVTGVGRDNSALNAVFSLGKSDADPRNKFAVEIDFRVNFFYLRRIVARLAPRGVKISPDWVLVLSLWYFKILFQRLVPETPDEL
jgi:hypothetical protein